MSLSIAGVQRRPLLCLSHLRWDLVRQRPHHVLERAARHWHVLYLEEPRFEAPGAELPRLERRSVGRGIEVVVPVLPQWDSVVGSVERQQRMLLDTLLGEVGQPDVVWYYTPLAQAFAGHLAPRLTVYDCMDELSAFKGASPQLLLEERRLLRRADLVFTGGQSLFEAKCGLHPQVHCFPSSIDAAHFGQARAGRLREPADLAALPRPRIGWFGVIDERMDLQLLRDCAGLRPDWSFVMVGPVLKLDAAELPQRNNIHWLGARSYAELPSYLAHWDAGLMPFALNEATRFISPTKTPEYLAAGLPVVSTAIHDVVRPWGELGLVEVARDVSEIIGALERVLQRPRAAWDERVHQQLSTMSWEKTWTGMLALMRRHDHRPDRSVNKRA